MELPNGSKRRRCDGCGKGIPPYAGMQGAGFQSETVEHEYVETVDGKNFHMPVVLELCYPCYLADYAANYPGATLPVIVNCRDWEEMPQEPEVKKVYQPPDFAGYFTVYA